MAKVAATSQADVEKHAVADGLAGGESGYARVVSLPVTDVQHLRGRLGLSQTAFAGKFALSLRTVQQWEQNRAVPDQPARLLLKLIEIDPATVESLVNDVVREVCGSATARPTR